MKLCIGILENAIGKQAMFKNYTQADNSFNLERWKIYGGETVLNAGVLYLSQADKLSETVSIQKGAAMICIGMPPEICTAPSLRLLVLDKGVSLDELANSVNDIFFEYNMLEYRLLESVNSGRNIQHLVKLMAPYFNKNELIVCDEGIKLIGRSNEYCRLCEVSEIKQPDPDILPPEVVTFFKNDIIYNNVRNVTEPFYYDPSIFACRCLCMNVFHGGEFACRVVVPEDMNPYRGYEAGLLQFFTHFIQLVYDLSADRGCFSQKDHMADMLTDLLKGEPVESWRIENNMSQRSWNSSGPFLCASVMPSERDYYNRTVPYYCQIFNRDFRGCCAFEYKDTIVCVVDLEYYETSLDRFASTHLETFRDGYFRVGYSNVFNDITELPSRLLQAGIALRLGLQHYPSRWYHKFSDMVLQYMAGKLTEELDAHFLCSPEILALSKYDKDNQSDYVHTLKVYLENQMNAVKTAKDLFIHRTTMEYRLSRIQELSGIDFKNPDQVLYFDISIRLLADAETAVAPREK